MSDEINNNDYCRLCAESHPKTEMLSLRENTEANSKVITKLSWINIDLSISNGLPSTICYACLELLERTWSFLLTVRSAQEKLISLFMRSPEDCADENELENGKVKIENLDGITHSLFPNDSVVIPKEDQLEIFQDYSDKDNDSDFYNTDIDVPLNVRTKNKCCHPTFNKSNSLTKNTVVNLSQNHIVTLVHNNGNNNIQTTDTEVSSKQVVQKKCGRPKIQKPEENQCTNVSWNNQACICAKCDMSYLNILKLQQHSILTHECCALFKCVQCFKVLPNYRSFVKHMRMHEQSLKWCCEYCNKLLKNKKDLVSHETECHKGVFETECSNCGMNFKAAEELKEHSKLFNKPQNIRMEYICDKCNKIFNNRVYLYKHIKRHLRSTKDYVCQICNKSFYTKYELAYHAAIHDRKIFKCDLCPKVCTLQRNLLGHIKSVHSEKPIKFTCELCGKSFTRKSNFEVHSITHTDLKLFHCNFCNRRFKDRKHVIQKLCLKPNFHPKTRRDTKTRL